METIRAKPVDMAVVDPHLGGGEPRPHGIERLRLFFPSLPLLIYTDLTPANAGVLLQLGRAGIRRVVVYRFEDAPGALRSAVLSELEQSASQQVMQALGGSLRELPDEIRAGLEAMIHAPGDGRSVTALADRAQLTRRTCERWFTKVGLPSPRVVMVLTRLLYAHRLLLDPGYTVEDVALKLGYSKAKTLQMHLRAVFGQTAGELRVSLGTDEALEIVAARYFTPLARAAAS
ncbi:MAG: helix-turn-helix domain-containing protein [Gemmatimonadales bacterium]|nr:helix-turn-helix domain-containing protein [Gemmatimonadales bacterium]